MTDPGQYAQVAVDARTLDSVDRPGDLSRPFFVNGTFTDEEVIGLVTFLRSNPGKIAGSYPLLSVTRQPDRNVKVLTASNEYIPRTNGASSGQDLTLLQQGTTWILVRAATWVE